MRTATTGFAIALALAAITAVRTDAGQAAPATAATDRVARGEFLVHMGGCDD